MTEAMKITIEEAERIAATFKPAWVVGYVSLSPAEQLSESDLQAVDSGRPSTGENLRHLGPQRVGSALTPLVSSSPPALAHSVPPPPMMVAPSSATAELQASPSPGPSHSSSTSASTQTAATTSNPPVVDNSVPGAPIVAVRANSPGGIGGGVQTGETRLFGIPSFPNGNSGDAAGAPVPPAQGQRSSRERSASNSVSWSPKAVLGASLPPPPSASASSNDEEAFGELGSSETESYPDFAGGRPKPSKKLVMALVVATLGVAGLFALSNGSPTATAPSPPAKQETKVAGGQGMGAASSEKGKWPGEDEKTKGATSEKALGGQAAGIHRDPEAPSPAAADTVAKHSAPAAAKDDASHASLTVKAQDSAKPAEAQRPSVPPPRSFETRPSPPPPRAFNPPPKAASPRPSPTPQPPPAAPKSNSGIVRENPF